MCAYSKIVAGKLEAQIFRVEIPFSAIPSKKSEKSRQYFDNKRQSSYNISKNAQTSQSRIFACLSAPSPVHSNPKVMEYV
jgi:hypothetical protein